MLYSSAWKSGAATLAVFGLATGTVAPLVVQAPGWAQTTFPDVASSYWAADFIQALVARGVIAGFPDGTFRPEDPVTRAQFAAMLNRAFTIAPIREPVNFNDVPANYWGRAAIQRAYAMGFMAGYPDGTFRPDENIPRAQVLVSLANGLGYSSTAPVDTVLAVFSDSDRIPNYARPSVAAATERRMVVNYPDIKFLSPNQVATRADVAAFLYQAMYSQGRVPEIASSYIVAPPIAQIKIPAGTALPVVYEGPVIQLPPNATQPVPATVKVAQNIVDAQGRVLIPAGSSIIGQLQPADGGARFVGQQLVIGSLQQPRSGQPIEISASTEVIKPTTVGGGGVNWVNVGIGTVVGAGTGAGIAGVTGDRTIQAWEPLTGAAVGGLLGAFSGKNQGTTLVVLPTNFGLSLTLDADLVLPLAGK